MRISNLVFLAPPLLRLTVAVPGIEPLPTPQGYLFYAGVSPRPTEAPGLNGIPKELVRREQDVIYPPPPSWCGFINGDYGERATVFLTRQLLTCRYRQSPHLQIALYLRQF